MEHTQTRFAPAPSEALPSFTAALKALDAGLAAIERVAWELREAAQAAAESGAEVMGATRDASGGRERWEWSAVVPFFSTELVEGSPLGVEEDVSASRSARSTFRRK